MQEGKTDGEGRIRVVIPPGEVGREIVFVVPDVGFGQLEVPPLEEREPQEWDVALQGGHNLEVVIVDAAGSPLDGVEVGLSVPSSLTQLGVFQVHQIPHARYCWVHSLLKSKARSDASGRVAFRNLPDDEYSLGFPDRSDVFPAPTSLYPKGIRVRFVRGMKGSRVVRQSPVTVRLLRAARILGTIVGPGGEPLREAYVHLDGRYGLNWHHVGKSGTGEDGRFHIALLNVPEFSEDVPGRAIRGPSLKIYHDNFAEKTFVLERTPRAGETFDVGPIRLDPFATLIVQFPNLPVARWVGSPYLYRAEDETDSRWVQIEHPRFGQKEDRLYVRCLAAGTYRLEVEVLDHFPRPWESDPIPISPGETRTITAAIERGLELVGQVIDDETGAPIEGAGVYIRPDWWRRSSTRNEGRFHLLGLRPGPGVLAVSRDGYSSISLWVDVAEGVPEPIRMARIQEPIEERAEAPPPEKVGEEAKLPRPTLIQLALAVERPNGLLLRKGEGCAIEIDGSDERYGVAPPDDAGLRLADVPGEPGSRFRVWAETYLPSDWIEPAKLGSEMLEPARTHIRLKDGPCTRIAVRRSDGTPVEGASVRVGYSRAAGVDYDRGESDADGEVALRPLPPGPVIIEVSGAGIVRKSTRCEYDGRGQPIPVIAVRPAVLECSLRYAEEAVLPSAGLRPQPNSGRTASLFG